MPRPIKVGLDYFPLDVDFFSNKKIKALRRAYGATGIAVYLNILCRVYSSGYYYRFTSEEDLAADIAEDISNGQIRKVIACVVNVIHHLVDNGIIDKSLYEQELVITGKAMQEQYAESACKAKRKIEIGIYQLGDAFQSAPEKEVNSEETAVNSEETTVISEFSTQSKVKESKEKNTHSIARARAKNGNIYLTDDEYKQLRSSGIPDSYLDYFSDRVQENGYTYKSFYAAILKWWAVDSKKHPWNGTSGKELSSFDTDDFFETAVRRPFKGGNNE